MRFDLAALRPERALRLAARGRTVMGAGGTRFLARVRRASDRAARGTPFNRTEEKGPKPLPLFE